MYRCPDEREVLELLRSAMASLPAAHRHALQSALIPPTRVPVDDCPGEFVIAVAQFEQGVLYWSDVEEGWEVEPLTAEGTIPSRRCNQFELKHVMYQLRGEPNAV